MPPHPSDAIFQIGDLLNNTFRIEAILGRGGTSEVYRARNEISGRPVALKVLKAEFAGNEDFLVLMKREEQMRDIRHDAVVGYSENHRTADGHIYLVMDYVDGPSLEAKLRQGGMAAEDLLIVGGRVAEGLRAAHARKIVHRDLSPDNIILRDGDPAQAVIIDFGIAKDSNPGAATIVGNEFAGKFSYAAPEQLSGNTDARSDIYSLGATLLATFRGQPPNVGVNLMEVIRRKSEPLDTEGVPRPLRDLIERMTVPDPAGRFQSCQEILDTLGHGDAGAGERTLVRPPSQTTAAGGGRAKTPPARPGSDGKSGARTGLILAGLVLLLAAGGAAAWFGGIFGPRYPFVENFVLNAKRPEGGVPVAAGFVPSPEIRERLGTLITEAGGTTNFTLAKGDIAEGWGTGIEDMLQAAVALDSFDMSASGNDMVLTGETLNEGARETALALFEPGALPEGLKLNGQIDFGPAFLTEAMLQPALEAAADCGPLTIADMPATGIPRGQPVRVTGRLSSTAGRVGLFDAIAAIAGDREVAVDAEVLNPSLCVVEGHLPDVGPGGFDIRFLMGETGQENPGGRYFVGENPVIDVEIPADVTTGYLYVSILDVTGSVFHLLPNVNRPDNSIADLRDGKEGAVPVRVAYSVQESDGPARLAFLVDDSQLGKSKVIVLHTEVPLFDELRPTTESVDGYAQALQSEQTAHDGAIHSLDSRILSMVAP